MKTYTIRETIGILRKAGFQQVAERGKHIKMIHPNGVGFIMLSSAIQKPLKEYLHRRIKMVTGNTLQELEGGAEDGMKRFWDFVERLYLEEVLSKGRNTMTTKQIGFWTCQCEIHFTHPETCPRCVQCDTEASDFFIVEEEEEITNKILCRCKKGGNRKKWERCQQLGHQEM